MNKFTLFFILHVLLGITAYFSSNLIKIYGILVFIYSIFIIIKNKNKKNEIVNFIFYFTSFEVFLRMTISTISWEQSKYYIIILIFIGFILKKKIRLNIFYCLIFILIIPSVFVGDYLSIFDLRRSFLFNSFGLMLTVLSALFFLNERITYENMFNSFKFILMPIFSIITYILVFKSNLETISFGTNANFATSGGYGPNQVATTLGIGMFISYLFFYFKVRLFHFKILSFLMFALISYTSLMTFSRGGTYGGILCIIILFIVLYIYGKNKIKKNVLIQMVYLFILTISIWNYLLYKTNDIIYNRYFNIHMGTGEKKDYSSGRNLISLNELEMFKNNMLFGVGVGKAKEFRNEDPDFGEDITLASHNEITRLLAEHGLFGLLILIILMITPFIVKDKRNLLFYSFYIFWLFTIMHSAYRLALPAVAYGFCLIRIDFNNDHIHRKQKNK